MITDKPVGKNDKKDLPIFCLPNLRQDLENMRLVFSGSLQKNANNRADWDKWKNFCDSFSRSSFEKERFELSIVGSLGYGEPEKLIPADLTTPDSVRLQGILRALYDKGCEHVFLEASSHGLHQSRLSGVDIDIAVLTNISQDHLDYHGTMDAYKEAKAKLFTLGSLKKAVINKDDEYAES